MGESVALRPARHLALHGLLAYLLLMTLAERLASLAKTMA